MQCGTIPHLHSDAQFETALQNCGIDTEIPPLFKLINLNSYTVPNQEFLIDVPENDCIPIEDDAGHELPYVSSKDWIESALRNIISTRNLPNLAANQTENITDYLLGEDIDDFFRIKDSFEKYCQKVSDEEGFAVRMHMCDYPSCLNSAVPGCKYCVNHIALDERFKDFKFISRCNAVVNGKQCGIPCSEKFGQCPLHRRKGVKTSSEDPN